MGYSIRKIVYALLLLSVQMSCKSSKQASFIQMTDIQFGFFNENKDIEKEKRNFEKAIAAANKLKPNFVIVTGDLINIPGDSAQIAA